MTRGRCCLVWPELLLREGHGYPTGQKQTSTTRGSEQVLDVHNEARHLANLKSGKNDVHSVGDGKTKCMFYLISSFVNKQYDVRALATLVPAPALLTLRMLDVPRTPQVFQRHC